MTAWSLPRATRPADRSVPASPQGRRHPDRNVSHPPSHPCDARTLEWRPCSRRRGPDRRSTWDRPQDLRARVADVGRRGCRAGSGADRL